MEATKIDISILVPQQIIYNSDKKLILFMLQSNLTQMIHPKPPKTILSNSKAHKKNLTPLMG